MLTPIVAVFRFYCFRSTRKIEWQGPVLRRVLGMSALWRNDHEGLPDDGSNVREFVEGLVG